MELPVREEEPLSLAVKGSRAFCLSGRAWKRASVSSVVGSAADVELAADSSMSRTLAQLELFSGRGSAGPILGGSRFEPSKRDLKEVKSGCE